MALEIRQSSTYMGKERWEWSVWLDGPAEDLDAIDRVIYILHSTFHDPVRQRPEHQLSVDNLRMGDFDHSRESCAKRRFRNPAAARLGSLLPGRRPGSCLNPGRGRACERRTISLELSRMFFTFWIFPKRPSFDILCIAHLLFSFASRLILANRKVVRNLVL